MNKDKKMILGYVVGGLLVIVMIINIFSVSCKIMYFEVCY